jgi:hypothetical protein
MNVRDVPGGRRGIAAGNHWLAASSVALPRTPGPIRRNVPDPIPVILFGRLAVDESKHQGGSAGASSVSRRLGRVAGVADKIGVRARRFMLSTSTWPRFYEDFAFLFSIPLRLIGVSAGHAVAARLDERPADHAGGRQ